jgi:dethiobiotin synthetase
LPRRLLVTGTDTGVGKTIVGAIIARSFRRAGLRVAVAKPVESGVAGRSDGTSDAEKLARAAGDTRPLASISPYRLRAAVAPTMAAEAESLALDPQLVRNCVHEALAAGDAAVVEGAGGLLVPLAPGLTLRSLAAEFDLPLLIVVADRLGCVNHALLTLEAARAASCRVCGFVLCRTVSAGDASRDTNRALLERLGDAPVLFEVPFFSCEELAEKFGEPVDRFCRPA